jgi:hypothetical protein
MTVSKKHKAIYIPADCISLGISRSSNFEKHLSEYYDLYFFQWEDPRNNDWFGNRKSLTFGIVCLFKNFFKKQKIEYLNNRHVISDSFLLNIALDKLLGKLISFRLMTFYNTSRLDSWIRLINPDIIFFMDGNYYFNYPKKFKGITVSDIQDDIVLDNIGYNFRDYIIKRGIDIFSKITIRFAVSKATCISMERYFKKNFLLLENGANIISSPIFSQIMIDNEKKKLGLQNKIIITFIGSSEKYDVLFAERLMKYLSKANPNIFLVTIGNLPISNLHNVINLGVKDPDSANFYYSLSDIGVILKDTSKDPFLYNSVPLKILQYSAFKKHVITFPLQWIEDNNFSNVHTVYSDDLKKWEFAINNVLKLNQSDVDFINWVNYDWSIICENMVKNIYECNE